MSIASQVAMAKGTSTTPNATNGAPTNPAANLRVSATRVLFVYVNSPRFDRTEHYVQCEFSAVLAALRARFPEVDFVPVQYGLGGGPDRILIDELIVGAAAVLFWCAVHEAPATLRAARLVREDSPEIRIIAWGDGPLWIPQYFARSPFDACVTSGDPEAVLGDWLAATLAYRPPENGVLYREGTAYVETPQGRWQPPEEWGLPDGDVIADEDYDAARRYRRKPGRDLSVTVARGCGLGCLGCVDPLKSGARDRRIPIERLVPFLREHAKDDVTFQLHGPMFGFDRSWCEDFAKALESEDLHIRFKCVSLVHHAADEMFMERMSAVGLCEIGVGVETLTASGLQLVPKVSEEKLEKAAALAARLRVRLTGYVQVGLPGQKREDVFHTLRRLRDLGIRVRPTGHTPFHLLRDKSAQALEELDLYYWDRKSYWEPGCGLTSREVRRLVTRPDLFESVEREEF